MTAPFCNRMSTSGAANINEITREFGRGPRRTYKREFRQRVEEQRAAGV